MGVPSQLYGAPQSIVWALPLNCMGRQHRKELIKKRLKQALKEAPKRAEQPQPSTERGPAHPVGCRRKRPARGSGGGSGLWGRGGRRAGGLLRPDVQQRVVACSRTEGSAGVEGAGQVRG